MKKTYPRIISGFVGILILVALVSAVFFRQDIYDWWRLRNYEPNAEIVALADKTTMTEEAMRIFYVTHPDITDAEKFNTNCHIEEFSIILGCYTSLGNIYVYDVSDKRLSGIQEVTAAHEMLHAAYQRLSPKERESVDKMVVDAYAKVTNKRIKQTVKQYQDHDASSVPNELHSILATEVRSLPSELEDYYKKYFTKRTDVIKYSEKYEAEFSKRQTRVDEIDRKLKSIKSLIDSGLSQIDSIGQTLNEMRQQMDQYQKNGNTEAYNDQVSTYNELVNRYNTLVTRTKNYTKTYNTLVKERNSLVIEVQSLIEAIDSTPDKI